MTLAWFRGVARAGARCDFDVVYLYREAALIGPALARAPGPLAGTLTSSTTSTTQSGCPTSAPAIVTCPTSRRPARPGRICRMAAAVTVGNETLADVRPTLQSRRDRRTIDRVPSGVPPAPASPDGASRRSSAGREATARPSTCGSSRARSRRSPAGGGSASSSSGIDDYRLDGVDVECRPWRAETEVEDLWPMDVGIMPLFDDPWARGKCAMKAIQYMGVGLPAVVSPVGANRDVVQDGVSGFHAASEDDWVRALERLLDDVTLRTRMGAEGRRRVERSLLGGGAGPAGRSAAEGLRPMTSLLDGLLAAARRRLPEPARPLPDPRARRRRPRRRSSSRSTRWTILLRYSLAIALNIFAANSAFAAAFWGDSGIIRHRWAISSP